MIRADNPVNVAPASSTGMKLSLISLILRQQPAIYNHERDSHLPDRIHSRTNRVIVTSISGTSPIAPPPTTSADPVSNIVIASTIS